MLEICTRSEFLSTDALIHFGLYCFQRMSTKPPVSKKRKCQTPPLKPVEDNSAMLVRSFEKIKTSLAAVNSAVGEFAVLFESVKVESEATPQTPQTSLLSRDCFHTHMTFIEASGQEPDSLSCDNCQFSECAHSQVTVHKSFRQCDDCDARVSRPSRKRSVVLTFTDMHLKPTSSPTCKIYTGWSTPYEDSD